MLNYGTEFKKVFQQGPCVIHLRALNEVITENPIWYCGYSNKLRLCKQHVPNSTITPYFTLKPLPMQSPSRASATHQTLVAPAPMRQPSCVGTADSSRVWTQLATWWSCRSAAIVSTHGHGTLPLAPAPARQSTSVEAADASRAWTQLGSPAKTSIHRDGHLGHFWRLSVRATATRPIGLIKLEKQSLSEARHTQLRRTWLRGLLLCCLRHHHNCLNSAAHLLTALWPLPTCSKYCALWPLPTATMAITYLSPY